MESSISDVFPTRLNACYNGLAHMRLGLLMLRILLMLFSLLVLFQSCGPRIDAVKSGAPVIIISIDTLRSDRLPAYGYNGVKTPAIDQLRSDAILFENAYAQTPLTLPSHATMFTGLQPYNHGVRGNLGFALDTTSDLLTSRFKQAGYETGAFVSSMVLRAGVGLNRDFDVYDDRMPKQDNELAGNYAQRRGDETLAAARSWLKERDAAEPFFLFLHLYDPHSPYNAPQPWGGQYSDPYDAEIAWTDSLVGQLIDDLKQSGAYDDALIILVSDHGEGLGDHGEKEHGMFVYREAIQIPMILKLPQQNRAGESVSQPAGLIDLANTLTHATGLERLAGDGLSLLESLPDNRPIYAESLFAQIHYGWHAQHTAVDGKRHYIQGGEEFLFDLEKDFNETNNLFGSERVPTSFLQSIAPGLQGVESRSEVSEEDKAMLASLGYTGSFAISGDIKQLTGAELISLVEDVNLARGQINGGQFEQASVNLAEVLKRYPTMLDARQLLATALMEQSRYDQAEFVLMEGLVSSPDDGGLLGALAETQLALGKDEAAGKVLDKLLAEDPERAAGQLLKPLMEKGRIRQAARLADWMAQSGQSAEGLAAHVLGRYALERGNMDEAIAQLQTAESQLAQSSAQDTRISNLVFLAEAQLTKRQLQPGLSSLGKALELNPRIVQTRAMLAETLAASGDVEQARSILNEGLQLAPLDPLLMEVGITMKLRSGDGQGALNDAQSMIDANTDTIGQVAGFFLNFGTPQLVASFEQQLPAGDPYRTYLQGRLAHAARDFANAQKSLEGALSKFQGGSDRQTLHQIYYFLGDSAANLRQAEPALRFFSQAVAVKPGDPASNITLATLLARLNQKQKAVEVLDQWLRQNPDPRFYQEAARVAKGLGLNEAAARYEKGPTE